MDLILIGDMEGTEFLNECKRYQSSCNCPSPLSTFFFQVINSKYNYGLFKSFGDYWKWSAIP